MGNDGSIELFQEGELDNALDAKAKGGDGKDGGGGGSSSEHAGLWTMFRESFDEFITNIIVPPRAQYGLADLGPTDFVFHPPPSPSPSSSVRRGAAGPMRVRREDFTVRSSRGLAIVCSWSAGEPPL